MFSFSSETDSKIVNIALEKREIINSIEVHDFLLVNNFVALKLCVNVHRYSNAW